MFTVHILSLLFAVCIMALADKEVFAWLRGKKETLIEKRMYLYHILMWEALFALIGSGILLALPRLSYLITQPLFVIKMLFVGILFVNAIILGRLMPVTSERGFSSLSKEEKMSVYMSGVISAFSWIATTLVALTLFS